MNGGVNRAFLQAKRTTKCAINIRMEYSYTGDGEDMMVFLWNSGGLIHRPSDGTRGGGGFWARMFSWITYVITMHKFK